MMRFDYVEGTATTTIWYKFSCDIKGCPVVHKTDRLAVPRDWAEVGIADQVIHICSEHSSTLLATIDVKVVDSDEKRDIKGG